MQAVLKTTYDYLTPAHADCSSLTQHIATEHYKTAASLACCTARPMGFSNKDIKTIKQFTQLAEFIIPVKTE